MTALDLDLHLPAAPTPATQPPEARGMARDGVRLLVIDSRSGALADARFRDLADHLTPGDLLVVNTSATIPGALFARRRGEPLRLHLAARLSGEAFIVERRTAEGGPDPRPFAVGEAVQVCDPKTGRLEATMTVLSRFHAHSRLWNVEGSADLFALAARIGQPIRYGYTDGPIDLTDYQTFFAREPGSVEMPSAARPFTRRVVRELLRKGIGIAPLVLHCTLSSHEVEDDLENHPVLPEWYNVPERTAAAVNSHLAAGRRVIALGTTVVRALESAARPDGAVEPSAGWTTLLVTPDRPPRVASALVTGLHESHTSHLALLYAFLPPALLGEAYRHALATGYLWHEFGDSYLIL